MRIAKLVVLPPHALNTQLAILKSGVFISVAASTNGDTVTQVADNTDANTNGNGATNDNTNSNTNGNGGQYA